MCELFFKIIPVFSFIKQYYEMLTKNPSNLYRFYKDESCMVHAETNDAMEFCTGLERIKARIAELSLPEGVTVDLKEGSVDAQKSENESVFLMVTGRFIHPNFEPRSFVQSFVLASQVNPAASQTSGTSYYVRNSVFRTIAPEVQTRVIERVVEVPVEIPVPAPTLAPVHTSEPEPPKEEAPEIDENVWSQPSSAIVEQLETEPEREVQGEEPGPPAPRSFADMVRSWGPPAPSNNSDRVQYNLEKQPSAKPAVVADERKENVPMTAHHQPSRSIFVNHVDAAHKQAEIESFFSKFGQVTNVDLPQGRGYAFVEFADHESIQAVLAAHAKEPLTLSGKGLLIEERQAKGRGAGKPRGDRAEGRDRPDRKQTDRKMGDRKIGEREGGRGKPAGDRKPTDKANRRPGPPAEDKSPKN